MPEWLVVVGLAVPKKRQTVSKIIHVHHSGQAPVPHIRRAFNLEGFAFRFCQRGQKQSSEDRDDGNDHEEFDQRKCLPEPRGF